MLNPECLRFDTDPFRLTVLGGVKLSGLDRLRVTVKVERWADGEAVLGTLREHLDLYTTAQVERYAARIAEHYGTERRTASEALAALTDALEAYRLRELDAFGEPEAASMTEAERADALAFLKAPDLLARTQEAIGESGVVGEETNRLLLFLAFTSRKLARPLHALSLGPSGSGKTHLQEAVARLIPEEDRIEMTTLTENALYYFASGDGAEGGWTGGLRHKLLVIEDLDGAERALYPLRELMSKGRLTKTLTVKDARGRLRPITVRADGPVSVAGCSTREALYEDNENRALVLHTDTSAEQDRAVLAYQRRVAAGEIDRKGQEAVVRRLQSAQRLLRPLRVVNPYAARLVLPERVTRRRRTNRLYLSGIEAVALYHQHQREVVRDEATGEEAVVATLDDVETANRLFLPVLVGRSDELSGACRRFFEALQAEIENRSGEEAVFRASEVRRALGASPSTLARHLATLRRFGLVAIAGGSRAQGYSYRLTGADDFGAVAASVEAELASVVAALREEEQAAKKPRRKKSRASTARTSG
ncbi:MAG: hypothetical protein AAFX41_09315 [Bacteroidota bacterium]